jgi:V/A-type H+-transporting ATPase subunit I
VIYTRPFGEIGKEVKSLHARFGKLHQKAVKVDEESKALTGQKKYLEALTQRYDVKLKDLEFSGSYLFSRTFILPTEAYENVRKDLEQNLFESAVGVVDEETIVHAIGKRENLETVESLIKNAGGKILPIQGKDSTLKEFLAKSEDELHRLEEKSAKLYEELQGKVEQELERIALLRGVLIAEGQRLSVLSRASEAKYVTLVEGWAPEDKVEAVVFELKKNIDYVFIDTRKPEPSEEPPTKQRNPAPLKPFQLIVGLFGTPGYREWDPTPIIAFSFAAFFGLMIADVVYAVGLILLGKYLVTRFFGSKSEGVRLLQKVIYISGGVGIAMGVLSGSYLGNIYTFFGFENVALSAGVQQVLMDPLIFIVVSLAIGFIHVNIGHIIALLKGIRDRNKGAIINKVGLFLLQLGIPFILRAMMNVSLPGIPPGLYQVSMYLIIAGLAMIAIGAVVERGGMGIILGMFDITGLLGDVMSYARIAGVGLATYYLAVVFNMLAPLFGELIPVSGMAGVIIGGGVTILILVMGHTLNLILSAITGFIHSLRLCFVEFLFKFYEGWGRSYSPFILRKRPSITVGAKS